MEYGGLPMIAVIGFSCWRFKRLSLVPKKESSSVSSVSVDSKVSVKTIPSNGAYGSSPLISSNTASILMAAM